jgi:hypothetical protein
MLYNTENYLKNLINKFYLFDIFINIKVFIIYNSSAFIDDKVI